MQQFTRRKLVEASNGGTLHLDGNWANAGLMRVNGGILNLGGSFTVASLGNMQRIGGQVVIIGTLNNAGTTLSLSAASGSWSISQGGRINGGTIVTADAK